MNCRTFHKKTVAADAGGDAPTAGRSGPVSSSIAMPAPPAEARPRTTAGDRPRPERTRPGGRSGRAVALLAW